MTRKDYEAIAEALHAYRNDILRGYGETILGQHKIDALNDVTEILADIFAEDNPRFVRDRFTQAAR